MTAHDVVTLAGGLALFLFGMRLSGDYLQKAAGRRLRRIIAALAPNRFLGAAVGSCVTACTNSSSATGVILVALTNAEVVSVHQSLSILLGAAVGTTITIQLIAFKITTWSLALVALGFAGTFLRLKSLNLVSGVLMAFGLIFFGMHLMAESMQSIQKAEGVGAAIAGVAGNKWLMVLAGIVVTAVIQSSSASIGILVALAMGGSANLTLASCFAFVLGANVGTCVTTILASIGGTYQSRRVAVGFLLMKGLGVLLFLPFTGPFSGLVESAARLMDSTVEIPRLVAHSHLAFNVVISLVFLAVLSPFEKLLSRLVSEREFTELSEKPAPRFLNNRLLSSPQVALQTVRRELVNMLETAQAILDSGMKALEDETAEPYAEELERKLDILTIEVIQYLARISQKDLDEGSGSELVAYLEIAGEIEAMGDVVIKAILPQARKKRETGLSFSEEGKKEINGFHGRVAASLRELVVAVRMEYREIAEQVLKSNETLKEEERNLRLKHLGRLASNKQDSIETSTIHMDLVADLAAVNSHAAAIAQNITGIL